MGQPDNITYTTSSFNPNIILIGIPVILILIIFIVLFIVAKKNGRKDTTRNEKELIITEKKMYCKNCGKEIDNNSKFCMYCGTNITKQLPITDEQPITNEQSITNEKTKQDIIKENAAPKEDENKKSKRTAITWIFCICLIGFLIFGITKCIDTIKTRSARNSDITITEDTAFSFNYNLIVKPNKDITDLQITFKFYGDNNKLIATKTKTLGNVNKNNNYSISFSLSEFSISSLTQISKYSWTVSGGTVKS